MFRFLQSPHCKVMISRIAVDEAQDGETTIPAQKLFDIIRALPDGSKVTVSQTGDKVTVQTIEGASHALIPERPVEVARAVISWMQTLPA